MIVAEVDWSPQLLKCLCNALEVRLYWLLSPSTPWHGGEISDCDYDLCLTDNCDMMEDMEDMEEWRMDDMEGRSSELCRGALIMIKVML